LTSATQHGERLLTAIIPDRRDLLDAALRHLTGEHFVDPVHRTMFALLERYAEVTGSILTRDALHDQLSRARADAGKIAQYLELYDLLGSSAADDADFRWSLLQLRELAAERATAEALTHGMEVLTRGVESDRGETLQGHVDARTRVLQRFAEIDRNLSMQESPEGDVRDEGDEILADYAERKAAHATGRNQGIEFGIPALDTVTGGVNAGELALVAAYTGEGKTGLCVQMAWNAVVNQSRNVVILTTETLRPQVRRRLMARHSCVEHFGIDNGLNSRHIKDGTLSPEQERQLVAVVHDFTNNPGYGRCYLVQVPRGATIGYIESKLVRILRMFPIDLVIMDYLALLRPDRRRDSRREELAETLIQAKQVTTTLKDGDGVAFVSPWQINRVNRELAEKTGGYTAQALGETSEASNTPDIIVTLLAPLDNTSRFCTARMQVLKARDAEKAAGIEVSIDYATSRFGAATQRRDEFLGENLLTL
jgi:replicative DNA helicase